VIRNLSPIGGIAIENVYLVTVARQSGVRGNPSPSELGLTEMPVMPERAATRRPVHTIRLTEAQQISKAPPWEG